MARCRGHAAPDARWSIGTRAAIGLASPSPHRPVPPSVLGAPPPSAMDASVPGVLSRVAWPPQPRKSASGSASPGIAVVARCACSKSMSCGAQACHARRARAKRPSVATSLANEGGPPVLLMRSEAARGGATLPSSRSGEACSHLAVARAVMQRNSGEDFTMAFAHREVVSRRFANPPLEVGWPCQARGNRSV
jgi:hypothetical protein